MTHQTPAEFTPTVIEAKLQPSGMFRFPKTEARSLSVLLISCCTADFGEVLEEVEKNDLKHQLFVNEDEVLCLLSWLPNNAGSQRSGFGQQNPGQTQSDYPPDLVIKFQHTNVMTQLNGKKGQDMHSF